MWDRPFWEEQIEDMARHRYNVISLWNVHPFPSLIRVPEYPTWHWKMAMDEKIDFWRYVMEYTRNRGIEFHIMTWNIFVWRTGRKYGISDKYDNEDTAGEHMHELIPDEKEKWLWKTYG